MTTKIRSTEEALERLPAPYEALIELGMTHEQVLEAVERTPLVVAFQASEHPGAWFDVDRARKALKALGAFKHTKGRWAGVPMRLGEGLDSWQVVWVLAPVFGWVYHDAEIDTVVRVIRTVWIEIPRKNGKSTFASGISGCCCSPMVRQALRFTMLPGPRCRPGVCSRTRSGCCRRRRLQRRGLSR
jgi:hypothetical protein